MSTRQRGNKRENEFIALMETMGYICYPSRGSRGIDVFCFSTTFGLPHIEAEVGGRSKSVTEAFHKMQAHTAPPGSVRMVVRQLKVRNRNTFRFHSHVGHGYDGFREALDAIA